MTGVHVFDDLLGGARVVVDTDIVYVAGKTGGGDIDGSAEGDTGSCAGSGEDAVLVDGTVGGVGGSGDNVGPSV